MSTRNAISQAEHFIEHEKAFHLGFLPTEQSSPITGNLDSIFAESCEKGVATLQKVDRNVLEMAGRVLKSAEFAGLVESGMSTVKSGGKIIFSGCGATGRLSILLESMWRKACAEIREAGHYKDSVESIMTGGDYALVKSVEFFEDYKNFGKRQVQEAEFKKGDMLVAITEGGETSSVLGSAEEALERGGKVFIMFNNPAGILKQGLERSRKIIEDERVTVLDLSCGPMAIAGSTRMQATTSEQLIAGAALESIMHRLTGRAVPDYGTAFAELLSCLEKKENVRTIANYIAFEKSIYEKHGNVTYFADDFMLDIFTDTTERSPTFMLPPFRKNDDRTSPMSWAFVKNPLYDTPSTWRNIMNRPLRCLSWKQEDYEAMGAGGIVKSSLPKIEKNELLKFMIGSEDMDERAGADSGAVLIEFGKNPNLESAFSRVSKMFGASKKVTFGKGGNSDFQIILPHDTDGALSVMKHMAVKLFLNTVSTGTMVCMGRVTGNWMSWVDCTNKKLVDRGVRLIEEIAETDYKTSCIALFESIDELKKNDRRDISPVQHAISKLQGKIKVRYDRPIPSGWKIGMGTPMADISAKKAGNPWEDVPKDDMRFISDREMLSVSIKEEEKTLRVTWKGHPEYGRNFTVSTIWKKRKNGLLAGTFKYSNYSGKDFVEEIHFPIIKCPVAQDSGMAFGGWDMGILWKGDHFFAPGSVSRHQYCAMQFSALLNSTSSNMYFDHRDKGHHIKFCEFATSGDGRTFSYTGIHLTGLGQKPKKAYSIPYESCFGTFSGSWFDAAQIYRTWAEKQKWSVASEKENPLRKIGMWVWNRGLVKDIMPPVLRLQKDCGNILVALDWYWWHSNPYDTEYPDFWPPREGIGQFTDAIKTMKDAGVFTQVYINGLTWDMDGKSWHEGGEKSVIIKRNGECIAYAFNKYNMHRLGYMCGEAPEFQAKLKKLAEKLHGSGLDGLYLDMIGGVSYYPCYNPHHSHEKGGGNYGPSKYQEFFSELKERCPDFPLSTENCNEAYMGIVDGVIICNATSNERLGGNAEIIPLFSAVYHGKTAMFGNYCLPDGIPPWDPLWPEEDRWKEEKAWHRLFPDQFFIEQARTVMWGAQPMVCNLKTSVIENPEFKDIYKFILDTAKFYHDNREFLFDGRMLAPDGFECAGKMVEFMQRMVFTKHGEAGTVKKELPVILHSCWMSPEGKKVLMLANYTADEQEWKYKGLKGTIAPHSYEKILL